MLSLRLNAGVQHKAVFGPVALSLVAGGFLPTWKEIPWDLPSHGMQTISQGGDPLSVQGAEGRSKAVPWQR